MSNPSRKMAIVLSPAVVKIRRDKPGFFQAISTTRLPFA